MKKYPFILALCAIALCAAMAETGIFSSASGLIVGASPVTKIGFFHGTTPVAKQANTNSAYAAMVNYGLIASGGTDPLLGAKTLTGDQTFADGVNLVLGSTTGTKIGTATTQKLGFFNATPVVQQTGSSDVLASLVNLGLRAASSNPPLNLGTGALTAGTTALGATSATSLSVTNNVTTTAPNTQTGSTYTLAATDNYLIINASGTCTLTLGPATAGRVITVKTIANQTVVSASSNVVPEATATAGTAILAGTAGKWARLVGDGTNWVIMESN